jgi:hypothetical protein
LRNIVNGLHCFIIIIFFFFFFSFIFFFFIISVVSVVGIAVVGDRSLWTLGRRGRRPAIGMRPARWTAAATAARPAARRNRRRSCRVRQRNAASDHHLSLCG